MRDTEYFGFGIDHVDIIGIDPFYDITDLADEVFGPQNYVNIVKEPRHEYRAAEGAALRDLRQSVAARAMAPTV